MRAEGVGALRTVGAAVGGGLRGRGGAWRFGGRVGCRIRCAGFPESRRSSDHVAQAAAGGDEIIGDACGLQATRRRRFTFTVSVLSSTNASVCHSSSISSLREMMEPAFSMRMRKISSSLRDRSTVLPRYDTLARTGSSKTPSRSSCLRVESAEPLRASARSMRASSAAGR